MPCDEQPGIFSVGMMVSARNIITIAATMMCIKRRKLCHGGGDHRVKLMSVIAIWMMAGSR